MKTIDLSNVQEAGDRDKLLPGGYVCGITAVEDVPSKEYLRLEFDIAEGEMKNYYHSLYNNMGFWGGNFIRSYKDKALPFFKSFISAVEKSNSGYKWDNDETKLKRKLIGLVLAEEEYIGKDGSTKIRLFVDKIMSADEIRSGNFKVPPLKTLSSAPQSAATADDDGKPVPF